MEQREEKMGGLSLDTPGNKTFRLDVTSAVYNIDKTKRISVEKGAARERGDREGGYEVNEEGENERKVAKRARSAKS